MSEGRDDDKSKPDVKDFAPNGVNPPLAGWIDASEFETAPGPLPDAHNLAEEDIYAEFRISEPSASERYFIGVLLVFFSIVALASVVLPLLQLSGALE